MGVDSNVVVITVDCLRADCLTSISQESGITCNIDRLANRGMLFLRAFSTSSWTLPSFKSVMASQYPFSDGGILNIGDYVTLPLVMKYLGYRTAAFHSNPWLSERCGYREGFDDFYYFSMSGKRRSGRKPAGLI